MSFELETTAPAPLLDLDRLEQNIERLRAEYQSAAPYPHIVIDDFLEPAAAKSAMSEFPPLDPEQWTNYLHVNERKFSNTDPSTWGPVLQQVLDELNSPRFVQFIGELLGVDNLIADPSLEGGGLHQSTTGGFLNIHADYTVHPHNRKWQRRANIILYLNDDWQSRIRWRPRIVERRHEGMRRERLSGGQSCRDIHHRRHLVPRPSREPMRCPEGVARRSLALYYFSVEEDPLVRSTEYRSRPGDGAHSVLIYADTQMLRAYDWAKRRLGLSDQAASKVPRLPRPIPAEELRGLTATRYVLVPVRYCLWSQLP